MCGIVGYAGPRNASDILVGGLSRLEYRGYDSAGIAVFNNDAISLVKCKGRVKDLSKRIGLSPLEGCVGIGHTRWATHGEPSEVNSHPHVSGCGRFYVVHNGIIENFQELKRFLQRQGILFNSETDSEVIAHLVEYHYEGDFLKAVMATLHELEGSYALSILSTDHEGVFIAAKKESPLVIGLGEGENYVASDIPAVLEHTDRFLMLDDREIAVVTAQKVVLYNHLGSEISKKEERIDWTIDDAEKGGFEHFMMKEICEIPAVLSAVIEPAIRKGRVRFEDVQTGQMPDQHFVESLRCIRIVACGTAYHAGLVGRGIFERLVGLPVEVELASEFRYREPLVVENELVIVISQSGETLDSLMALKEAKRRGSSVLSIVNAVGSSIARASDFLLMINAGPEIAVASTKAYNNQLAMLELFAIWLAQKRVGLLDSMAGVSLLKRLNGVCDELLLLPEKCRQLIQMQVEIQAFASQHYNASSIFYLGRGLDYALAMEGSLKLKEISYIHSEAYAGGELKHGTIALIEPGILCICPLTQEPLIDKMISNMIEVKTRGALLMVIVQQRFVSKVKDIADCLIVLPDCDDLVAPIEAIIPMQLFAYYVSVLKGCDVDQPRNLAKSVTVE